MVTAIPSNDDFRPYSPAPGDPTEAGHLLLLAWRHPESGEPTGILTTHPRRVPHYSQFRLPGKPFRADTRCAGPACAVRLPRTLLASTPIVAIDAKGELCHDANALICRERSKP
jgi:hypothetical protein